MRSGRYGRQVSPTVQDAYATKCLRPELSRDGGKVVYRIHSIPNLTSSPRAANLLAHITLRVPIISATRYSTRGRSHARSLTRRLTHCRWFIPDPVGGATLTTVGQMRRVRTTPTTTPSAATVSGTKKRPRLPRYTCTNACPREPALGATPLPACPKRVPAAPQSSVAITRRGTRTVCSVRAAFLAMSRILRRALVLGTYVVLRKLRAY